MATGRVLHAGLQLLDRQLVDRNGRLCGKVDDLELSDPDDTGSVHVTAILCGPGALLLRTGHPRIGQWLRRLLAMSFEDERRVVDVPFQRVADIGNHITLSLDDEQLPSFAVERWFRDHIVNHIPGSRSDAAG